MLPFHPLDPRISTFKWVTEVLVHLGFTTRAPSEVLSLTFKKNLNFNFNGLLNPLAMLSLFVSWRVLEKSFR